MRLVGLLVLGALAAAPALADPPQRDAKSWAALIEGAKKHGGTETKLDQSSSYVFQQQDGNFLTLTEWRAPLKRFVCVIAKDKTATVCVRWETGQTTYGQRADEASPWKTYEATPLEETKERTQFDRFLEIVADFIGDALDCQVDFYGGFADHGGGMFGGAPGRMVFYARRP